MKRVIVVGAGAGAAGSMAATLAALRGADTLLLEHPKDDGRKVLNSGRFNVLPLHLDELRYATDSSRNTMRRILRSWPPADQRALVV